jgi:FkbM family methyltransferase
MSSLARRWGEFRRRRIERRMAGARLLRGFAAAYPEAVFVEIGANDGEAHDHLQSHIRRRGWRGVMVEPVPYVFERLRANYGDLERVKLENAAIAESDGELPFWHLPETSEPESRGLPDWYHALGSLSRDAVLANRDLIPGLEEKLVSTPVRCLTLDSLLARHGLDRVDLFAVDTEGYDAVVVGQLDLARVRPRLILYEHYHLGDEERSACRERLAESGYEILEEHFDTFALDPLPDRLTSMFRRLEPSFAPVTAAEEHGR